MKKITLEVKGMHCTSCEMLIKEELLALGVSECGINHKTGRVTVTFDENRISLGAIKDAIKKEGYGVL